LTANAEQSEAVLKHWVTLGVFLLAAGVAIEADRQAAQFRSGIDLIRVDVTVLDRNRRPVEGLTAADFTLTENGVPQAISSFAWVRLPAVQALSAPWARTAVADVATNTLGDRRLFILYLDDQHLLDQSAIRDAKAIAQAAIEQLGPGDLGAVVFPVGQQHSQQFTNDRGRLLAAVAAFQPKVFQGPTILDSLRQLADLLATIPERRKVVLYIGPGMRIDPEIIAKVVVAGVEFGGAQGSHGQAFYELQHLVRSAQRANVSFYTVDPRGLAAPPGQAMSAVASPRPEGPDTDPTRLEREFLQALARETGGRAIVNDNEPARRVPVVFSENNSYYLLGFRSTDSAANGKFRRLAVKVNRPGVEVHARGGYYAASPETFKARPVPPIADALARLVPVADVPMQLAAAPFSGAAGAAVAVSVRIDVPVPAQPVAEGVEVLLDVFDTNGRSQGAQRQRVELRLAPGMRETTAYTALFRSDLRPGKYEIRASATVPRVSRTGSVFGDVEVPDFASNPVSLSGLTLEESPAPLAGPAEALSGLLPIVPTTLRVFSSAETIGTFFRVYQGGNREPVAVPLAVEVVAATGKVLKSVTETVAAGRFRDRKIDCRVPLPISELPSGAYVLRVRAAIDARQVAQREVPFVVR
jgi:VWFA-related protein